MMTAILTARILNMQKLIDDSGRNCLMYSMDFLLERSQDWLTMTIDNLSPAFNLAADELKMRLDLAEIAGERIDPRDDLLIRLEGRG